MNNVSEFSDYNSKELSPSFFAQSKEWVGKNQKNIAIALVVVGLAVVVLGIGLAAGGAVGGSLFDGVKIGSHIVTYMTSSGKMVIGGLILTSLGALVAGIGTGLLIKKICPQTHAKKLLDDSFDSTPVDPYLYDGLEPLELDLELGDDRESAPLLRSNWESEDGTLSTKSRY